MKTKIVASAVALAVGVGVWVWAANRDSGDGTGMVAGGPPTSQAVMPKAVQNAGMRDLWLLRPPAGAKVAVVEFDDLECPACAHAVPILHAAVARYRIPLVHHDFPLTEIHIWSFDAAVTARHLQDSVSPQLADEFRKDVFASQVTIANKDDLGRFTARWFVAHNVAMPFVMDPSGACRNEVQADRALGDRIGVGPHGTPCIFVVTQQSTQLVEDIDQLSPMIEAALAQTNAEVRVTDRKQRV